MDVAIREEEIIQNCDKPAEADSSEETLETVSSYDGLDLEEYNQKLYDRILTLRKTIHLLKKELKQEREIWKHEIENKKKYDYFSRLSQYGVYSMQGFQDNFVSNYENRKHIEKEIEVANYKRRLIEVENMCQMELMKVKQSVQILQPLQMMMSEWKFDNECGDSLRPSEVFQDTVDKNEKAEIDMPLEGIIKGNTTVCEVKSDTGLEDDKLGIQVKESKSQPDLKAGSDVQI